MKLNTKIEADFYNLQTCKIPLHLNNIYMLFKYILHYLLNNCKYDIECWCLYEIY